MQEFDLKINAARGLPRELSQGVYCRYRFFGDEEDYKTQVCTTLIYQHAIVFI